MLCTSVSLALCTVMFRRFMDSFSGHIPTAIQNSPCPNTTAMFMFSGALYYLYNHLKKGTLVRIGIRIKEKCSMSGHSIQKRRPKTKSWILRNAASCRNKYTDAVFRMAKQSIESLVSHNLNPTMFLKNKHLNFGVSTTDMNNGDGINVHNEIPCARKRHCNVIYSNKAFQDCTSTHGISDLSTIPEERSSEIKKSTSDAGSNNKSNVVEKKAVSITQVKRKTEIKKKSFVRRITRKTRSGRVYAYRL